MVNRETGTRTERCYLLLSSCLNEQSIALQRGNAKAEKEKIRVLLKDAINEGAKGLSTGLIYPPGIYSDTSEIIELKQTHLSAVKQRSVDENDLNREPLGDGLDDAEAQLLRNLVKVKDEEIKQLRR